MSKRKDPPFPVVVSVWAKAAARCCMCRDPQLVSARLRDFLGLPPRQVFFLTYDVGAAFRARKEGLVQRLLTK